MLITRFQDEYSSVAALLETTEEELRSRDCGGSALRWIAVDSGEVVGVVTGRRRPDGRVFVKFGRTPPDLFEALSAEAARGLGSVYALARSAEQRRDLSVAGFEVETIDDEFAISFDASLGRMGRLRQPRGFELIPPHELDTDRMVALDTELRHDVPGTSGWQTTAELMEAELASPEYDPSGYLVGVEKSTGEYHGLVRFWRNSDAPRLGLLAVSRRHRGSMLAAALLRKGLEGASQWGSTTFGTSTSPSNQGTYPALMRLGAKPIGRRHQMVCRA